jgi:hypothetical protein
LLAAPTHARSLRFEERAKERDDGQTHWRKASHLLFPNSKNRHQIGIDSHRFCCAQLP